MIRPGLSLDEKMELFFDRASASGVRSTLRVVRDDAHSCREATAFWPETMTLLAGTDLLALLYAGGRDAPDGARYREFLRDFFELSHYERIALYKLRCATMHSFGWYAPASRRQGAYRFQIDDGPGPTLERLGTRLYRLHLPALRQAFEDAVARYESALAEGKRHPRTNRSLRDSFSRLFYRYGLMGM